VDAIGLRIGALSGVDAEALRFALEASTLDTPLAGVRVDIECLPVRAACRACRSRIEVMDYLFICPQCGSGEQGEELQLARITGHD
jgi:hydrogenase nickel incorporation protein HypA/HybF